MLERILSALVTVSTVLVFAVGFIGFYQQTKFIDEWAEDHANSMSTTRRWRLSATAIFSKRLSPRCRKRRQRLLLATCMFAVLLEHFHRW
jgi:hypothetical protein